MSSSDAQKSPVHHATEDSMTEPTHDAGAGSAPAAAARSAPGADPAVGWLAEEAARLKARPDTAMGVPGNFERGAATADVHPDTNTDADATVNSPVIGGGPGAGDASSGGGAGAGNPGGGTDLRTNGAFSGGDPGQDRKKLFPDQSAPRPGADETAIGKDRDESSYGGPLKIDDPSAS
jgi:hypothetical protein